jgi:predicted metal-dependent hydrolase
MIDDQVFVVIVVVFVLYVSYTIYNESDYFQLKCIISDVNSKKYCVRERKKLKEASNLLAQVAEKLETLIRNMKRDLPDDEMVRRIATKFNSNKIKEVLPTSEYTAYSENKGEKLALCLNEIKEDANSNLIDGNTLMYVAMHEVAHIGTVSIGHNDEFWKNFKTLIQYATKYNLYQPVDYKNNNKMYCGLNLTDNPYYDA